jgi:rhamnogalacturonan endolyase
MKIKVHYTSLRAVISFFLAIAIVVTTNLVCGTVAYAASIGVNDNGSKIVVDTGAGLVYTINKTNGDMISCKLNGTELNATNKASQISSGLGSANVTWSTFSSGSQVLITCTTSTLTQYYASKYGDNTIYMATYITAEPSVGELRYVFRGDMNVLNTVPTYSDLRGNSGAVESTDVYGFSDGHVASKYYGNDQAKDLTIKGATGKNVGVFMAYGNRETSSGGPFQRDIQFQTAMPDNMNTEINNYMNSTHAKTENFRTGLFGPYALCFTNGTTPSSPDYSWMSGLGLQGYVGTSDRGKIVVNGLSGMDTNYVYTIGFANSTAQYWAKASSTGVATCSNMKAGTYTMTVYKGELGVYTKSATVTAGGTTTIPTSTIDVDPGTTSTIWRIGKWDGTPLEFLNGTNIQYRHPSDNRNASWGPTTFAVGSADNKFPAAQFRGVNSPTTVTFNLDSNQAAVAHTLKIGITTAYNNGRPSVTINGHVLADPSAAVEPGQRTLTVGTYRGNNATYTWSIPASYFVAGSNIITIKPVSGSSDSSIYLSASYAYDCLELDN